MTNFSICVSILATSVKMELGEGDIVLTPKYGSDLLDAQGPLVQEYTHTLKRIPIRNCQW